MRWRREKRRQVRRRPKRTKVSYGRCRDCSKVNEVDPPAWYRASHPRCDACGGMLDRLGSIKNVHRSQIRASTYGTAYREA